MAPNASRCPLCGTELSEIKLKEIQSRIRADEEKKSAEIRSELDKQYKLALESQRDALKKEAVTEANRRIKQISAERDQATKLAKDADAKLVSARKQIAADAENQRLSDLLQQRQALENDKKSALLRQQGEFNRKTEGLQKKVQLMEKQLQNKTANELGDCAEIDLFEELRGTFQTDRIVRVAKGQTGADIVQEVLYKGSSCGKIIIDCKNRQSWQNSYVAKLRQDQVNAKAEHAILATSVFPAGKKEMWIESDVILVSPGRVVHIVQLLRNAMVTMHVRGVERKGTRHQDGQALQSHHLRRIF